MGLRARARMGEVVEKGEDGGNEEVRNGFWKGIEASRGVGVSRVVNGLNSDLIMV